MSDLRKICRRVLESTPSTRKRSHYFAGGKILKKWRLRFWRETHYHEGSQRYTKDVLAFSFVTLCLLCGRKKILVKNGEAAEIQSGESK
jgi:hypothetical protein